MHLRNFAILGLIALIICSGTAYAGLTGVIAGKVVDVDGNPIPGVTITVTGENLPGARVDVTSSAGTYRMPELPPGVYTVEAAMMGMQTIKQTNVKVSVNQTTNNKLTMQLDALEIEVVVDGSAEVLDVKAATVKATIERDVTERLPGSDDLFSAFSMSGGITGSGNVRVHGASNTDNVYLFDGVDTTDPVTSTFGANLNSDAIEQVEVQTGGFQAEYGRSMGGIVNAVTKSGGNDFHGIIRVKYVDTSWAADDEHPTAGTSDYDYFEPTVTFEGPIIRDKLWFMVSYNYLNIEGSTRTLGFYDGDYLNEADLVSVNTDREFHLPYIKLTFQPTQEHKFVVNYSGEDATLSNSSPAGTATNTTPEAYNTQEQGGPFYSLEWTWLTSPNLYFIARVGSTYGILDNIPTATTGTDPRDAHFYDTYAQQYYNNANSWSENDRDRLQVSLTASYFIDDLMGQHEWKTGIEYHATSLEDYADQPGGAAYTITQTPVGEGPDYYTGTNASRNIYLNPGVSEATGDYYAFYLQDDWAVTDTITLNLGVRYEWMQFKNDDGDVDVPAWTWGNFARDTYINDDGTYKETAPMEFTDMLAPRIGFNWDVFGNGKTAVHAFYGRFFNPFDLSMASNMFQPFSADNTALREQEYIGPEWSDMDRDGVPDEDFFFDDANWRTTHEDEAGDWNLLDPDLEAEYTDEIMFGIEQEIMENFSVGLTYTHRESNDMVEDVGIFTDDDGNIIWTYLGGVMDDFSGLDPNKKFDPRDAKGQRDGIYDKHLYYITNAEGNSREYNGIEINARARQDSWDLQASYTYAKAEGAVTEAQPGYSGIAQFSGQYDTPGVTENLYGELPWSCRHYVKLAGSYHFDVTDWYEMSFGVNAFWRSGYHYSMRSKPPFTYDEDNDDINDPENWTGQPPYRSYNWSFMKPRGSEELPSFYNIDFSFQQTFKFGRYGAATVIFDVENLTDNQGIVSEAETYNPNKPEQFGQADQWASPRNYRLSLKYSF